MHGNIMLWQVAIEKRTLIDQPLLAWTYSTMGPFKYTCTGNAWVVTHIYIYDTTITPMTKQNWNPNKQYFISKFRYKSYLSQESEYFKLPFQWECLNLKTKPI